MNSCTTDKLKVFIRYEENVIAVLLPKDVNFGNLVKYVWKKFQVNDAYAIRLSYNNGGDQRTIVNEVDLEVFKILVSATPSQEHTIIVHCAMHTADVNLDPDHQMHRTGLNCMPTQPQPPTFDYTAPYKNKGGLKVHHLFEDKEECMYEISLKCLKEGYEFCVSRSCTSRYAVKCVQPECDWHISCRRYGPTCRFRITSLNDNHKCSKIKFNPNHRNAYTKTLARIISPKLGDPTRVYKPKDFIHDLKLDMNIDISYRRAWRGRQLALESNQGCPKASFSQLPLYCHNLKIANRGTVTHIQTDDASCFKNLFIGFGAVVSILLRF